ncbi:MAG: bifunctional UDP-N-acetylglucosamine diphosphorylase/glucosamine-1-phosphate N-acetyltransferase GlmU [Oscillospiraceae bacterium]|nr:bifunctional UDP-N-acetylglucosamine diphosphorylase/glucosamine-1-phosphate N-acetyltransferase GlmU [Oscillospiraceae bacterium]
MGAYASQLNCVILAAGEGKRMHASGSKVLCKVAGKEMLRWVIDAARASQVGELCVVASGKDVESAAEGCEICEQTKRLGTGHAVMCARGFLEPRAQGDTLVLCGDAPFIDRDTICGALDLHRLQGNAVTVISAEVEKPAGYGRIIRRGDSLAAIVEDRDCNDAEAEIQEINSGAYWFKTRALLEALESIKNNNAQGEYYLTDAVAIIIAKGLRAGCFRAENEFVALGANRPSELLRLNEIANRSAIERHLENGVHFVCADGVVIGPDVELGAGCTVEPNTQLYGRCKIGEGCVLGPGTLLTDCEVGEGCLINASQCAQSKIGSRVRIGPYVNIRPGSLIADEVKIGDFVEIKNSSIGRGSSIAHLTYIGDSDVGSFCNFGCGVVVVNYDGEEKRRTTVGDYAFIGCNTNLIAPVSVGDAAYTAAGTTVAQDVPAGALALGRVKQRNIEGWAAKKLQKYIEKKGGAPYAPQQFGGNLK